MMWRECALGLALSISVGVLATGSDVGKTSAASENLDSIQNLDVVNGKAEIVEHKGRRAVHLVFSSDEREKDSMLAIINGSDFEDGTIEIEVAGTPKGAEADSRGFIGVAFRVQGHGDRAEYFYLRPTNGRADDQLRRNHSLQYVSEPEFPWFRLRKENPGVYESYADVQPGMWTKMKIVVAGTKAQLYINGADQPSLIVNDLKHGESRGAIALWAYWDTDAYFTNLKVH